MSHLLNYRRFIHSLASMNAPNNNGKKESTAQRIGLLFDVWDGDSSGTLSKVGRVRNLFCPPRAC